MTRLEDPARLLRNWQDELDSAALYAALAQLERDPHQRSIYQELASASGGTPPSGSRVCGKRAR